MEHLVISKVTESVEDVVSAALVALWLKQVFAQKGVYRMIEEGQNKL